MTISPAIRSPRAADPALDSARPPAEMPPRRPLRLLGLALLGCVGLGLAAPAAAQQDTEEGASAEEFPLYRTVTGPLHRPVTTDSPGAQAYFDQGLQLIYAFSLPQAIASFEEAQRRDPACAMCWFGEAWARGPYLNGGMRASNAAEAFEAIQRAVTLAGDEGGATEVERAMIDAMSLRYTEVEDEERRPRLDSLYSRAMHAVHQEFPDDLDVGTLYAESLMLLNPARGEYELDDPFVQRIHAVLEDVLEKDITHPGACHIYIHATEATERPEKAEECADHLGEAVPGSSHINHMPSHTYNRIGRWNSAVRSNIDAWHADQRAAWDEGISYGATHNLHMLLFAGSMAGQGAVSLLAAETYADQVAGGVFYEALVMLRFGWFEKILALDPAERPEQPIQRGLFDFARGYAHLRDGDPHLARAYLARVGETAEAAGDSVQIRGATAELVLGIAGHILEGEIVGEAGDLDGAIAHFEDAVELHDRIPYAEPELLNFASRHWLGAALLEADRAEEAEAVYRASLEKHPHNGWSIRGLEQALRAQGRTAEAEETREWFREAWSETDTLIRGSIF
ncbi:MAG: hypothetical protein ACLFWG_06615 [Longimicrobiales bacterium]